jgi:membrane protease YdiL (CAAX protease family)
MNTMRLRGALAVRPMPKATGWRWLLFGPAGLRAGWRLAIALIIAAIVLGPIMVVTAHLPALHLWARQIAAGKAGFPPAFFLLNETVLLLPVLAVTAVMAFLEAVPFTGFGLQAAGRRWFGSGALAGLVSLSLLVGVLCGTGHGVLAAAGLSPVAAIMFGAEWLLVFVLVGFTEEMLFRGYLLATLARGIGFWPAAVLTSLLFGLGHGINPGETPVGQIDTVIIALVLCLSLRVTGALWWAIGYHITWDWAESYFYGTPDSGIRSAGRLLTLTPRGDIWWSGGATGPEGSLFVLAVCAGLAALVYFRLRPARSPA